MFAPRGNCTFFAKCDRNIAFIHSLVNDCGVECSRNARFRGDWPGSFGLIDVTNRQTDQREREAFF